MSTNWHSQPLSAGRAPAHRPPADAARLVPVLTRAIETGHGPPALVNWLARRRAGGAPDGAVTQLAAELNRVLRRAGVTETLSD